MNLDQMFTQTDSLSGSDKPALPGKKKPSADKAAPNPEKQFLEVLVAAVALARRQKAGLSDTGNKPAGEAGMSSVSAGPDGKADRPGATVGSDLEAVAEKDAFLKEEAALLWMGPASQQTPGEHPGFAVADRTHADPTNPDRVPAGWVLPVEPALQAGGPEVQATQVPQSVIGNLSQGAASDVSYRDADGKGHHFPAKAAPDAQWTGDPNLGKAVLSAGAAGPGSGELTGGTVGEPNPDQAAAVENKPTEAVSGPILHGRAAGEPAGGVKPSGTVGSAESQAGAMHRSGGSGSETTDQRPSNNGFSQNPPAALPTPPAGPPEVDAAAGAEPNGDDPDHFRQQPLSDSRMVSGQTGPTQHAQAASDRTDQKGGPAVENAVDRPSGQNEPVGAREMHISAPPKMTAEKTGTGTGTAGRDASAATEGKPLSPGAGAEVRPETEKPSVIKDNAAPPGASRDMARPGPGERGPLHSAAKAAVEQPVGDRKGPEQAAEKDSGAQVSGERMATKEADTTGMTADRLDSALRSSSGPGERDPGGMPEQRPVMNPAARDAANVSNRVAAETEASVQSRPLSADAEQFQKVLRLNQIVDKAALQIKQGASEIQIELKPEYLGRVRMHIAADNNQVAVKIMAELPAVREIIESNLSQLKSDLQNQGVNVNQLDVAVFSDSQRKGRRGRTSGPAAANKVGRTAEGESDEAHGSTERVPTGGPGNGNRISFFA